MPLHDDAIDRETTVVDLARRRPEVLRRLLARGLRAQTLQTLLPGWEPALEQAAAPAWPMEDVVSRAPAG